MKEREHSQDLVVDGRIILKCFKGPALGGVDRIHLAQDMD
jgi:hypothetical protein